MGNFLNIDGPFMSSLNKIADVLILNLLFVVCCLPVFTIGAAYTAMYYVTLKMVKDEDCYTFKSFFKSFKQNFKQATVIWLIMLLIGIIIVGDLKIMGGDYAQVIPTSGVVVKAMNVLLLSAILIYSFTLVYVFPVLSRFDNTVKNTLKNSLLMSIRHFPSTLAIIAITFIPIIFMYLVPKALILMFMVFGLSAYLNSCLFVKIFKNYMPETTITSDEDFSIVMDEEEAK